MVITKCYPRDVHFGEGGSVIIGGSDHGVIYIFDTTSGASLDIIRHSRGRVQVLAVSESIQITTTFSNYYGQVYQHENKHFVAAAYKEGHIGLYLI